MSVPTKPYSEIPNFEDIKFVDENGYLTNEWRNILMQLFQGLQSNFSNEGLKVPQQPAANLVTLSTAQSIGSLVYDSDNNKFKACIPNGSVGEYKEIQLV